MALTDSNEPYRPAAGAREALPAGISPTALQALARLPQIHAETSEAAGLARFLHSAVRTGAALMLMGALAVIFVGGASLKQEFAWGALVLAGEGAMLRSYIRSVAQGFDRAPLREAAKDLRAILFYCGFAWGAGAFLLLGDNPVPIIGLGFAVLPTIVLVLLMRDRTACLAFVAPLTLLTASAIILQPWGNYAVALTLLLVVQGSIAAGLMMPGRTHEGLPAGLSLR